MRCVKLRDRIGKKVRGKKGRYKIIQALTTKGGMGDVFDAETMDKSKTEVVIKFAQTNKGIFIEKLHREAEFLHDFQKSKPEGIVAYIDEADEKEEEFFLVIEKLKGQDLAKIGSKQLDEKTVIKFSNEIAGALHYLHGCRDVRDTYGIIHRDIDPNNIVVAKQNEYRQHDGEEHCVLIDFGAATGIKDAGSQIGKKGWSCKHNFLPPYNVSQECDIYALGRVMFYMATGQLPQNCEYPYGDDDFGRMQYKATSYGASPELSNLIDDMIQFPRHKIQTAEEVIQRLSSLRLSTRQTQRVQSRKYTVQPQRQQQQLLQGPHIILGGHRYPIVGNRCEIGQSHNCPDPNFDCSRGILHPGMDGFDYPHKPDIEIPLIGSPPESVSEFHHIRIWKDNGQWYVRDLDTTNYSAILKKQQWIPLNDGHKGKTMTLDEDFTKLAIGYRSGQRTEIEFSFYKQ